MGAVRHSRIPKRIAALAVGSIMGLPAVGVAASAPALGASGPGPAAKSVGSKIVGSKIVGTTPRAVSADAVVATRPHDATAVLTLNLGLAVRNSADLDARIRAASTPGDPGYGHYLTNAEYRARYAPTDAQVAAVRTWLTSQGARVTSVSPDNLIVGVRATTATAERAFRVSLHDYRQGNRTLYANDVAPSVPADSSVRWVTGLDDFATLHHFADTAVGPAFRAGGYFPSDFRKAYGVSSVPLSPSGVTNDETIGLTLWGAPLLQSDLTHFAGDTSTPALVINQAGANGINFIPCSTASCNPAGSQDGDTGSWDETALDVESAHGIAPGAHLKYWLGTTSVQGGQLLPDVAAVEQAVNAAANDSSLKVVSNSWGFGADVSDPTMDTSLQHAAAVGTTFYFSTGDSAAISYPATSPYVVAVGGTSLNLDGSANYVGESAWSGSGSGCSGLFARPVWQVGVGNAATCGGRAEPDVAADADPATGAYVFVGASASQIGGTSLAAPLWAGMTAVWNEANLQAAKPGVGFAAPLLYSLANNPTLDAFHDVVSGSAGGHAAGTGWDEVTGWGSPKLANMVARHLTETATTTTIAASSNPVGVGGSVAYTATVAPAPSSGTVAFRKGGVSISGCSAVPVASGHAHCTLAFGQAGTFHIQASYGGNVTYAGSASGIISQQVVAPAAGYWMAGASGAVYAFGSAAWHGNARTAGVVHFEPTPSRRGYWIVNRLGQVYAFGDARALGNAPALGAGETVSSLSSTPTGNGYWLFTSRGRALRFGDARFYGDLAGRRLNQPVIGSVATPSGHGYFMVASDGGIFSFGDAGFFGSTGGIRLNRPVNGLVPTATNRGYWLVASDGGIFAFGDARFRGSMGATRLNRPVVGMVRYGDGYLMVGSDGGIFDFSDRPFLGSLAGKPLSAPIVSVAT